MVPGFAMGASLLFFLFIAGGLRDQARGRTGLQLDESRLPGSHRWSVLFEHLHGLFGERMATTCYNHRWMRCLNYAEIPLIFMHIFMHIYAHVSFTNLCWTFCGAVYCPFPGSNFGEASLLRINFEEVRPCPTSSLSGSLLGPWGRRDLQYKC